MKGEEQLRALRHSVAHLLAAAVLELWPDTLPTIGPAIKHGFYYDFQFTKPLSETDLPKIEKKMRQLLPSWTAFTRQEVSLEEAQSHYIGNPYKDELINEIHKKGEAITLYRSGSPTGGFEDLCRGGHVENPSKDIPADGFKLTHLAGAYWRGDEKNPMLTRVYGVAFASKNDLDAHLARVEEAKKRDHRKLGQELDLFTFSDLVGAGLPLYTPKGTVLRNELENRLTGISKKYQMQAVSIPHLAKIELYEKSGHAEKFADELFRVISHYNTEFVLKPVNCPHHTQIYASKLRSYRDLPLRYMESTAQYRDEKPGEISGLTRTRGFTVDDAHIFCTVDQIKHEAKNIAQIIEEFYTGLGMYEKHWVSLSVRDPKKPETYIGDPADWEKAEVMLQEISNELGLNARHTEGEAAIYGPKLDYMFEDALQNERQLATIQIDFAMPKRFGLVYKDSDGGEKNPVMIHRAILGSYERFLAILIEHFAGAFPVWLSPVQVGILPIAERHQETAAQVQQKLEQENVRVEVFEANETLGKRIRTAQLQKVPYIAVIGDKENADTITIRRRGSEEQEMVSLDQLVSEIRSS